MPKLRLEPGQYRWNKKEWGRGIFARGTQSGVVYGISYQHQGRRKLEAVGPTLTLAREALAVRKAEIAQGKFSIERTTRLPRFHSFVQEYLQDYSLPNKRSYQNDEQRSRHLVDFFGPRRLNEITSWEIERYRSRRTGEVSIATINRELALLKHMLGFAVKRGYLRINPGVAVKLGREVERPFRTLSSAEEAALLKHSDPWFGAFLVVALNTGLRRGELLSLEWRDIDMAQRQITVRQSKSGRVRHVPLNQPAMDALNTLPRDGLAFGLKVDASRVNRLLANAVKASGIQPLRIHDIRHTFATRLVLAGVDLPTVQELLGHASILMTRRYSHPTPEHRREAVQRLASPQQNRNLGSIATPKKDRRS